MKSPVNTYFQGTDFTLCEEATSQEVGESLCSNNKESQDKVEIDEENGRDKVQCGVVIRFNVGMIMSLVTRLETKLLVMKKEMFLMKTLRLLGGNVRLGILDELK